jgi:uncharacterized membrane protein YhaH (DUF805 family)
MAGRDFHPHMDRLISVMDQLLARKKPAPPKPEPITRAEDEGLHQDAPGKSKEPRKERPVQAETTTAQAKSIRATTEATTGKSSRWQKVWHFLTSREGRLTRGPFALGVLGGFAVTALLVLGIGIPISESTGTSQDMPPVVLVFPLAWAWALIILGSKRLQDLNWDARLVAIPLLLGAILPVPLGLTGLLSVFVLCAS